MPSAATEKKNKTFTSYILSLSLFNWFTFASNSTRGYPCFPSCFSVKVELLLRLTFVLNHFQFHIAISINTVIFRILT